MSSAYIQRLVYFDGYKQPEFIQEGPTQRIWSNMGIAIKKGAKWGDFAVFNREELFEVLAERATRSKKPINCEPIVPKAECLPQLVIECVPQVIERAAPSSVTTYKEESPFVPVAKKDTLRAKLDKFLTPKRALCAGCGTYCVHSKPPENWNASDRKRYCCLGCRDSAGKKHADRCQKHKY